MSKAIISVVVPTIAPRRALLDRAIESAQLQTLGRDAVDIIVVEDKQHLGAAATRNRGLGFAETPWVAFLDDDDTMDPEHLEKLLTYAQRLDADLVYPWFHLPNGTDPFPDRFGVPFDAAELTRRNYIPVTVLARTLAIWAVGGFTPKGPPDNPCEDWGCWEKMIAADARFVHLPERTWTWNWHGGNTSGRGDRW